MIEHITSLSPGIIGGLFLSVIFISLSIWKFAERISITPNRPRLRSPSDTTTGQAQKPVELPEWYWRDPKGFQLERRAIFSKTWICVSHVGRFAQPGDYVSHDLASFQFFLILGKDGLVRAFHNVCRHRAFPVTKKASGSSTVLSCQYHGWSYNTKGELIKAPQFDGISGFDKSQNSLFEIQTRVDSSGFIHINLNGLKQDSNDEVSTAQKIDEPAGINRDSQYVHTVELTGKFNWKIAGDDRLQKCMPQAMAGISRSGRFNFFSKPSSKTPTQFQFFPLTAVFMEKNAPFWYQITYYPDSAEQTRVRCDVYMTKNANVTSFDDASKERLETKLKLVIQQYEAAFSEFTNPQHVPVQTERNQFLIANLVKSHLKEEELRGTEIKPASVQQCRSANFTKAEGICRAMECSSSKLDW